MCFYKMKIKLKRLLASFLCALLALSTTALAIGTEAFWTENETALEVRGIGRSATNNTGKAVDAHYALVSYKPGQSMWTGTPRFTGQVHFFDIALARGESKLYSFDSGFTGLPMGFNFIWVKFDDKADMEKFKASVPFRENNLRGIDDTSVGVKWMKDTFNIAIAPVK